MESHQWLEAYEGPYIEIHTGGGRSILIAVWRPDPDTNH
jgi:hypothetical protein